MAIEPFPFLPPVTALRGEENLDEWKLSVARTLSVCGLDHCLDGARHAAGLLDGGGQEGGAAALSAVRRADGHRALLIMSQSVSGIRDWLVLQGFDADEGSPARYFDAVVDVFARLANATAEATARELRALRMDAFDSIRGFQQRLVLLRGRFLREDAPNTESNRENEVLWWAVGGVKTAHPWLHARLVEDMLRPRGHPGRLTWSRLMMQLAHIHERRERRLGPEYILDTEGPAR